MTFSMQLCASPQPTLQQAIDTLIDCFGRHDTEGYFDCFHPEARFVFYTVPGEVLSKAAVPPALAPVGAGGRFSGAGL